MTLFDLLDAALARAAAVTPGEQTPPVALVWTDPDAAFERLVPAMRARWPGFVALGPYDPAARTGPALWLRCVVDGTLPVSPVPDGAPPVVYLPGVSREGLRDAARLPEALLALADLPDRGALVHQENGRDWTPLALLVTPRVGAGLDVARDAATAEALARALPTLARDDLARYAGQRLDAAFLNALLLPDTPRTLLEWLDAPDATRARHDADAWAAFAAVMLTRYALDPDADGPLTAAQRLGTGGGPWDDVWARYADAPARFPGVAVLLDKVAPPSLFDAANGRWPSANRTGEAALRKDLAALAGKGPHEASEAVRALDDAHRSRREGPWATLGQAPLAHALGALVRLADATLAPLPGDTLAALASAYASDGWQAEAALLDALAAARSDADLAAVGAAARAVYLPWAERLAERVQAWAADVPAPTPHPVEDGTAYLFVDGLRLDVANRLAERLSARGLPVRLTVEWAALPTVTPTAKAAASPAASRLGPGTAEGAKFCAALADTGAELTSARFRKALAEAGVTFLAAGETGTGNGCAWTEEACVDSAGHDQGLRLAHALPDLLDRLAERVLNLREAGWARARVVTDHGWLLLPGGLPKASLERSLAIDRWGRCATLKPGSDASNVVAVVVPWHWDASVRVALAPDVRAFAEGYVYTHGGLTLPEALVPHLVVEEAASGPSAAGRVGVAEARWTGLRLRVALDAPGPAHRLDLRLRAADPASAVATALVKAGGTAALLVEDDTLEGTEAVLVVLSSDGQVLAQHAVTVGG